MKNVATNPPPGKNRIKPRPSSTKRKLSKVTVFRRMKKFLSGKTRLESLDLLDQWILKKKTFSLFF